MSLPFQAESFLTDSFDGIGPDDFSWFTFSGAFLASVFGIDDEA